MLPTYLVSWSILTARSGCRSKTSAILQMVHSPKVPPLYMEEVVWEKAGSAGKGTGWAQLAHKACPGS